MVFRTGSTQPGRRSNGTCFGKGVGRGCARCTHVHILERRRAGFSRRRFCPGTRCQVRAELPVNCRLAVRSGRRPTGVVLQSGWPPAGENGAGPESGPDAAWRNATARRPALLSTDLRPAIRWRWQGNSLRFASADPAQGGRAQQERKSGFPAGSRQGCALVRSSHACHEAGATRVEGGRAGCVVSVARVCVHDERRKRNGPQERIRPSGASRWAHLR